MENAAFVLGFLASTLLQCCALLQGEACAVSVLNTFWFLTIVALCPVIDFFLNWRLKIYVTYSKHVNGSTWTHATKSDVQPNLVNLLNYMDSFPSSSPLYATYPALFHGVY